MSALPEELINQIERLVEQKFNELLAANKLDVTSEATSLQQFADEQMLKHDGDEPITQGFFRIFLDWLGKYYTYNYSFDSAGVLAACRYIAPNDLPTKPDCAKVISPMANLVLHNASQLPTIPDHSVLSPNEAGFNPASDLMVGGLAYNKIDNKWYYMGKKQGSYTAWHLPSLDLLLLMHSVLYADEVDHFSPGIYWTSSEVDATHAYAVNFETGETLIELKSALHRSRGSRAFVTATVYQLKDIGPNEGRIFRKIDNLNGTYTYYETAEYDQGSGQPWSNVSNVAIGFTTTNIGDSTANTNYIKGQLNHISSAAKLCFDLTYIDEIYELRKGLGIGVEDISDFELVMQGVLAGYVLAEAGKGLSTNDLTDELKTGYDGAVTHAGLTDIHLEPDGTTIQKGAGDKLEVIASAIKAMLSGTAPIAVDVDGVITLAVNTDQFEIVDGKLQIKAAILSAEGTKLSFNEETGVLSVDAGGAATVDLSSLSEGGPDLSDYVKKTGVASQTISGALKCTGEIEPFAAP